MDILVTLFFGLLLGLVLGSFTTAIIARAHAGISIFYTAQSGTRSACPHCGHTLSWTDLVPLFSWLFLKGKCRYCGAEIGKLYPLTELSVVLLSCALFYSLGVSLTSLFLIFSLPFLVTASYYSYVGRSVPYWLAQIFAVLSAIAAGLTVFQAVDPTGVAFAIGKDVLAYFLVAVTATYMAIILSRLRLTRLHITFFTTFGVWLGSMSLPLFMLLLSVMSFALSFKRSNGANLPVLALMISAFLLTLFLKPFLDIKDVLQSFY